MQQPKIICKRKRIEFTDEAIENIRSLLVTRRKINNRLLSEGIDAEAERKKAGILNIYDLIERGEVEVIIED